MQKNKVLNFLLIGDSKFFHTIRHSVIQINRLYPSASIYIYDWGFTKDQFDELVTSDQVKYIKHIYQWDIKLPDIPYNLFGWKHRLKMFYDNLFSWKNWLGGDVSHLQYLMNNRTMHREILFANKVLCYADFIFSIEEDFIFLDADAILVKNIDEIFKGDFDIGVTIRRQEELDFRDKHCQVLNSGVLFFLGGFEKNHRFILKWLEEMSFTKEPLIEQTALTRLIQDYYPGIYKRGSETGDIDGHTKEIKVKIFPCEVYNYNWIEEGIPDSAKILHFKGSRHSPEQFNQLIEKHKKC